jgi:serine/threonine-protein kinase 24/25/MST4
MRVLFLIPKEPPPSLREEDGFSALFCNFVATCLYKEAAGRPSARELLDHPFITQARFVIWLWLKLIAVTYPNLNYAI